MQKYIVQAPTTLLDYLFKEFSDTPKTRVRKWLQNGQVAVNGQVRYQFNFPMKSGDAVQLERSPKSSGKVAPDFGVKIIESDNEIVVVEKPVGLLSVASEKDQSHTVIRAVNDYLVSRGSHAMDRERAGKKIRDPKAVFIIHRLDRDVAGLMVLARTWEAKLQLQDEWDQTVKRYYALVEGRPPDNFGVIKSYLKENARLRVYSSPDSEGGKLSETRYEVIQSANRYSLLDVDIRTGRKHQIRVHLADIGCPIVGDRDYGAKSKYPKGIALYAYYLSFVHPETGKRVQYKSAMPDVMKTVSGTFFQNRTES